MSNGFVKLLGMLACSHRDAIMRPLEYSPASCPGKTTEKRGQMDEKRTDQDLAEVSNWLEDARC